TPACRPPSATPIWTSADCSSCTSRHTHERTSPIATADARVATRRVAGGRGPPDLRSRIWGGCFGASPKPLQEIDPQGRRRAGAPRICEAESGGVFRRIAETPTVVAMALDPDARLTVDRKVDVRGLPLTPIDFFVFSRVESLGDGTATVADVIAASGQSADVA